MSVTLSCSFGNIDIELYVREAPRTCRNFLELCKAGYYDGITFHVNRLNCLFTKFTKLPKADGIRVIPNFICQSGDPTGTGKGGESIYGPRFEDEMSAKLSHDRKGMLSMANFGRNTNNSQFFIIFRPSLHLDGKHAVFGRVKPHSLSVLDRVQSVKVKDTKPITPIKLYVAEVISDPWEGCNLPEGCSIPRKPLIGSTCQACTIQ